MTPSSPLARSLAPLASLLTPLYMAISVLVALIWITGFGEGTLAEPVLKRALPNEDLRNALALFSKGVDSAWVSLGAVLVYLAIVRAEGLPVARRWCGLTLAAGFLISAASAITGWPLGPVFFPINLGWKIGPVPFALPLLWLVLILSSRELTLRILPGAGHVVVSLVTGVTVTLTIANLDPLAWKYRAWWLWYPTPGTGVNHAPWQSYLTWALAGIGLAWTMRSPHVAPITPKRPWAPITAWAILNGVFLLTHIALWLR